MTRRPYDPDAAVLCWWCYAPISPGRYSGGTYVPAMACDARYCQERLAHFMDRLRNDLAGTGGRGVVDIHSSRLGSDA